MKHIVILIFVLIFHSNSWAKDDLGSLISPGDLAKSHAKYDSIIKCIKCHKLGGGVPDSNCLDCHDKLRKRIRIKKSLHAKYSGRCIKCHRDHKGRSFKMISLNKKAFDHDLTNYLLKDKHAKVKCEKCHTKKGIYSGVSKNCISCHKDIHKGQLNRDCGKCHNFSGWKEVKKFNHDKDSKYSITGKHKKVKCKNCHRKGMYKVEKFNLCKTCHKDPHKNGKGNKYKKLCKDCHTTNSWKKVKIDHTKTKYALTAKHKTVSCNKCHKKSKLTGIPYDKCNSFYCHNNPHKKQFKGKKCEHCHTTKGWKSLLFNHNAAEYKGYKLEGKHLKTKCSECHKKDRYVGLKFKSCSTSDCHKNPHGRQFKKQTCVSCHTTKGWKSLLFNHNAVGDKGYRLDGKHLKTKCSKCHKKDRYVGLKFKSCSTSDCHKNPHGRQFKKQTCVSCHTTKGWGPSLFEHNAPAYKGYRLDGKHLKTLCDKCHLKGQYKPTPKDCLSCHKKDDVHKNALGKACNKCHNTTNWKKAIFDHNKKSEFPLIGKHKKTKCEKCHKDKKYQSKAKKCADCHKDIHKGEYKEGCNSCHNQSNWEPSVFPHGEKTGFVLKGVHHGLLCIDCHKIKGVYRDIKSYCSLCHRDPHFNQFGTINCDQCHGELAWYPVKFDHNLTGFPLRGQHRMAECEDCHQTREYNLPENCMYCHRDGYMAAPGHAAKGYSQNCIDCHPTNSSSWTFKHAETGIGCSSCHLDDQPAAHLANPTLFPPTCEGCHKTTTAWTAVHTSESTGCSTCHINASSPAKPADHSTNNWVTCEDCHNSTSVWTFTHPSQSIGCSTCHLTYSTPAKPADHSTNNWTTCEDCHNSTSAWTFTHPSQTTDCSTCHLTYSTPAKPADHSTNNWVTCEDCHNSTSAWTFTHPSQTTGCSTCHLNYSTPATPADHSTNNWTTCEDCHNSTSAWTFTHPSQTTGCATCHLSYSTPATPADHSTNNWTTCEDCHNSTSAWTFTHPTTTFPLNHKGTNPNDCDSCHPGQAYNNSGGCIECHTAEGRKVHETNVNSGCLSCHPTGKG